MGGFAMLPVHGGGITTAAILSVCSVVVSVALIIDHLVLWKRPNLQKQALRIIVMAPLYAVVGLTCVIWTDGSTYLVLFRDCWEAFTLYSFFKLITRMLNGERSAIRFLAGSAQIEHVWPFNKVSVWSMGGMFFYRCKYGILQYVLVKPVLASIEFIEVMQVDEHNPDDVDKTLQIAIMVITNVSQSVALYCLAMFYLAVKEPLSDWKPMPKFLSIKLVVFATWWQSFMGSILVDMGLFDRWTHSQNVYTGREIELAWRAYLVCIEMFVVSVWHHSVFSADELSGQLDAVPPALNHHDSIDVGSAGSPIGIESANVSVYNNLKAALSMGDVHADVKALLRGQGTKGYGSLGDVSPRNANNAPEKMSLDKVAALAAADALVVTTTQLQSDDGSGAHMHNGGDVEAATATARAPKPAAVSNWKRATHTIVERIGGEETMAAADEEERNSMR